MIETTTDLKAIYQRRFSPDLAFRVAMWRELCAGYFQRFVPADSTVLEVGAGYCEFINNIIAARKIAVDLNPATREFAGLEVQVVEASSTNLSAIRPHSVDIAFASNFFEHLTR